MTITYNLDIPDAPNNPSNDQPKMKTNTNAINAWTAVDHVEFGSSPAGTHLQTTFSSKNTPAAQTDPQSVLYTADGIASTVAQMYFRNQNTTFQVSPIKAWAICDATGAFLGSQSLNVVSVTHSSAGVYTVVLSANAVSGTDFAIFVTTSGAGSSTIRLPGYNITGVGTFTLTFLSLSVATDPVKFSFMVLQI